MPNSKVIAGLATTTGLMVLGLMAYQPTSRAAMRPDHYLDLYRINHPHCTCFFNLDE